MIEVVLRHERGGSAREQRSANRVRVRIVFIADLAQRFLEQIADDQSLTKMEISERINVDAAWVAQIFVNIPVTTAGRIRAYSVSTTDGTVTAEDSVGVTFNKPAVIQPYIKIQVPSAGTPIDTSAPIVVMGDAAGLFEGGLVVQALDQNGAVLAQAPTTINAPAGGVLV